MPSTILIKQATIVSNNKSTVQDIFIANNRIEKIAPKINKKVAREINAEKLTLIPGVIDDQVHFREPGLSHKADIFSESRAAVAGGTTSFMEMPNTIPQSTNKIELEKKYSKAKNVSPANYSFYLGATNNNLDDIKSVDVKNVCGIKIFMGSSTGNMLVNESDALEKIFEHAPTIVTTHCEVEEIIKTNTELAKKKFGENIPISAHPEIRNIEACYQSSKKAIKLARENNTNLHILHISTEEELELFEKGNIEEKQITAEVCVHHLTFSSNDYEKLGSLIKCNPAIKEARHRVALWEAIKNKQLDIIATDHAPHTWEEKQNAYLKSPSGVPLVQHALYSMIDFVKKGHLTLEKMVELMSHNPAKRYQISDRGYISEGQYADLVLLDLNSTHTVEKNNILYKCGWSPFEGRKFLSKILMTIVSGQIAYENGKINNDCKGMRLSFDRD